MIYWFSGQIPKLVKNVVLFQAVEQDRHLLRKKLTSKESELDARILELENDLTEVQSKLGQKETLLKQWERDKSQLVGLQVLEFGLESLRSTKLAFKL